MKAKLSMLLGVLFIVLTTWAGNPDLKKSKAKLPEFTWENGITCEMGSIKKGVAATAEFLFKNTGKSPLLISTVKVSCGCTLVNYPKEAVNPGKTGVIKVTYNAASVGFFEKKATVVANTESQEIELKIKGQVE